MLQLTPASVIFVATIAIDFRKGIDGLIAVCRQKLSSDPLNGSLFLFYQEFRS
ncbi:IS66 family insertion sequence element accessory protein TnpB [Candidatus Tisiphia endosymbiont of Parasteatoda lunata]|uniref:IS66 family insertion sequence element accessory protein TnpB n=1 Tax=Candidatus Tisiphia endosymbiont of Parasteatoda lunata TaxID=3066275 RepID=UPI00313A83EC